MMLLAEQVSNSDVSIWLALPLHKSLSANAGVGGFRCRAGIFGHLSGRSLSEAEAFGELAK